EVTASVVGSTPLNEESRKLAEMVAKGFDADGCIIRILEGGNLVFLGSFGVPEEIIPPSLPANWGVYREVMSGRRAVVAGDLRSHAAAMPFSGAARFASSVDTPMVVQNHVIGVMSIYTQAQKTGVSETDLEHLQMVANHIAVAILNDRLF